jgi:hypothetical protein
MLGSGSNLLWTFTDHTRGLPIPECRGLGFVGTGITRADCQLLCDSDKLMDEEATDVTKFFFDEGMPVKVIIALLKKHYREDAIFLSMIYYWLN